MSFRYHRSLPIISVFHNSNPESTRCLALLRSALSSPYPPATSKTPAGPGALQFELSTTENVPPTADQIRTILSYLRLPLSTLVSAHPTSGTSPADSAEALVAAATSNPKVFRYPVIVNWDDGEAALESSGVKKMLDKLAARRGDGSSGKSSSWF
ncbi:hypothetical protein DL93DRAFT_2168376 [Clavulina sp. PMI_390]|nr:hypothetical protein DL93DRAFT_2168376 [Clavulina sp. PMI_390]